MPRYSSQEIDEIADTFLSAKERGKPAHVLFGGGCSKSAGIPLASELVAVIQTQFASCCRSLPEADRNKYGPCMKLLTRNERRDLLAPYLRDATINWAHIALAQLLSAQFIERALTVNFDNLLARACGLLSLYPAIYDFGSAPTSDVALIVSPAIVHLHGQGHGVVLLNTEEETKVHAAKIAPVLHQSMDHPLLVIGYSGLTDDVLRLVREHYHGGEYLYWLSHRDEPNSAVRNLADGHEFFKCVGGVDADRFLIELAQKLRCWPPGVCTNPIGHLLAELKPVADYPTIPGNKLDILATTRLRLAELEKGEQEKEQATRGIEKLLLEGRFDEAVKAFETVPAAVVTDEQRNLAMSALLLAGNSLYEQAIETADNSVALDLFEAAEAKYEAALAIKPNASDALYNWGVVLSNRAERASGAAEAADLFKAAEAKYEAALAIEPGKHEALYNWGVAFSARARRASDAAEAADLFKAAEAKYEAALAIKPDKHDALFNWGVALLARARHASDAAKAAELFKAAEAKCEAALAIKPDDSATLHAYGTVILEHAKRTVEQELATNLLKIAAAKLKAAREKGDGNIYNLACVFALLGHADECRSVLEAAEKGSTLPGPDHLEQDGDLRLVRELPWFAELIQRLRKNSA